jgi:hypothetical protein
MIKKSQLNATGLAVIGLLFVAVMLLANLLLRGAQIDLTADKLYTISDGTEHIVENLKEPINLYLFFSEHTATPIPQIKNHGVRVRELLEELASRSKGKLTLKVIDPQPFSEEEDRATELGITSVPVNASGEKLYLGLAATNSTDGKDIASKLQEVSGGSGDGKKATDFASAAQIILDGGVVDYDGYSGPITFDENGDPTEATIGIYQYQADNTYKRIN